MTDPSVAAAVDVDACLERLKERLSHLDKRLAGSTFYDAMPADHPTKLAESEANALTVVLMHVSALRAELAGVREKAQLLDDLRAEYQDENDEGKAACDRCEHCGPMVMCSFHSVLSALFGRTPTTVALRRKAQR